MMQKTNTYVQYIFQVTDSFKAYSVRLLNLNADAYIKSFFLLKTHATVLI